MNKRLAKRMARLEHQRADLLADLARLSPEQLEYRPDATSWSIAQVLEHLAAAEEAFVAQARAGGGSGRAQAGESRPRRAGWGKRMRRWYGRRVVFAVLRFGVRVRMPRRVVELVGVPEPVSAAAANARWEAARGELAAVLSSRAPGAKTPVFHHPVTGPLTQRQGLDFVYRHVAHHRRQIARIREAGRF